MVKSKTIELSNFEKLPAGQNASVAIMSFTGYDIEDAVILNRSSLDRGFGRAMYMRRYQTSLKKYDNGASDMVSCPPPMPAKTDPRAKQMRKFHALGEDGLARVGEKLQDGDIYINKYRPDLASAPVNAATQQINLDQIDYKPEEQSFKGPNPVYADRMILTSNFEEQCVLKMITR